MKRLFFILMLPLLLSACDRSSDAQVAEVAKCVSTNAREFNLEDLGHRAVVEKDGYPVHIARFDVLSCRGAKGLLDNNKTMDAQGAAITTALMPNRDFRVGVQARAWETLGKPIPVARELAGLVVDAGDNLISRAWAQGCNRSSETVNDGLRALELPYYTAYVGTRGFVKDVTEAQNVAATIVEQAKSHALIQNEDARRECSDKNMAARFDLHMTALKAFAVGMNDKVPGCRAESREGDLVLKCGDPAAAAPAQQAASALLQ
jgi:hypothetical protein